MLALWAILLSSAVAVSAWYCEGSGWTEYMGKCYLLDPLYTYGSTCSAVTCASYCATFNARMLCIEDLDSEQFISDNVDSDLVWLDYSDATIEGDYVWGPTCANSGYTNWNSPTEPDEGTGVNCAAMSMSADSWYGTACEDTAHVSCYCEKPAVVSTPDCPHGWTVHGDECMLMDKKKGATTWYECQDFCQSYNGRMLCVDGPEKEDYILDNMGTLPEVWLSYNDIEVEGHWRWGKNCDNNGYTHWDRLYYDPNGGTYANCAELFGPNEVDQGWNDVDCSSLNSYYPIYCFCEGSGGDPTLRPYTANGSGGNGSTGGTSTVAWIIVGVAGGCLLLGGAAWLMLRHRSNMSSGVQQQSPQYAGVSSASSAVAPAPYGDSAPNDGSFAYNITPYDMPYTYPNGTGGVRAPGQYAAVPPGGYGGGYTGGFAPTDPYRGGGGTVGMVPLAPSAPPAGVAYAPQEQAYASQSGCAPAYQPLQQRQQYAGPKTSSAPASAPPQAAVVMATATAVPYSAVGAYDNYGDDQVVIAEAVVASADV